MLYALRNTNSDSKKKKKKKAMLHEVSARDQGLQCVKPVDEAFLGRPSELFPN